MKYTTLLLLVDGLLSILLCGCALPPDRLLTDPDVVTPGIHKSICKPINRDNFVGFVDSSIGEMSRQRAQIAINRALKEKDYVADDKMIIRRGSMVIIRENCSPFLYSGSELIKTSVGDFQISRSIDSELPQALLIKEDGQMRINLEVSNGPKPGIVYFTLDHNTYEWNESNNPTAINRISN